MGIGKRQIRGIKQLRYPSVLLLAILVFCLNSCIEGLGDDPISIDQAPILAKCILTPENRQTLNLFYASLDNGRVVPVDLDNVNATLRLLDSSFVASFRKISPGEWQMFYRPEEGTEYMLSIAIPGKDTIIAKTEMPRKVHVRMHCFDNWDIVKNRFSSTAKAALSSMGAHILEENGSGLMVYYKVLGDRRDDCYLWISNDFGSKLGTNHIYADKFNLSANAKFDSNKNPLFKTYGSNTYNLHDWIEGNPLHEGPVRIIHKCDSNVNGFPSPIFSSNLLPEDNTLISEDYTLAKDIQNRNSYCSHLFSIYGDFTYHEQKGNIIIYQMSESLDRYFKSVERYLSSSKNDILEILYADQDVIFSNTSNGIGIFGSCSKVMIDILTLNVSGDLSMNVPDSW